MLEKAPGNYTVEKLRALLLLEADFNGLHEINFNRKLMPSLQASSSTPQEIIGGRRSQASTHLAMSKKLINDISNTRKLPTVTTCIDATNFYDSSSSLWQPLFAVLRNGSFLFVSSF